MQLSSRFNDAMQYALELHARQARKAGGQPYAAHLLAVAALVLEYGANEDEAIAALLHDAVEDQGGSATAAEIRRRFGATVADIVEGCSDSDTTPKPPWQERKAAYLAKLEQASPSVRLIVAADKLHNVRSITRELRRQGDAVWKHFKAGREKTIWYYRTVVEILRRSGATPLVEELHEAVEDLAKMCGRNIK
jgi:(p)ppGpp synthase/HD superfamily hydrolase